jgi:enolase
VRAGAEVHAALRRELADRKLSTGLGAEGGPRLSRVLIGVGAPIRTRVPPAGGRAPARGERAAKHNRLTEIAATSPGCRYVMGWRHVAQDYGALA